MKSFYKSLGLPEEQYPVLYLSSSNEKNSMDDIQIMGDRLASEINDYITQSSWEFSSISFICHSLGGIIARTAIQSKLLFQYHDSFATFCSFGTPHCSLVLHSHAILNSGNVLNNIQ
jgi:triacylglycerol esterase/lipase EstA (alpha/beta hydrolase family)